MKFVVTNTHRLLKAKIFGWAGWVTFLSKTCAFLGNDYDFMSGRRRLRRPNKSLVEKVKSQVINLIQNEDVDTFLVGEIGGFEEDAYDAVLEVKKIYPNIQIVLVISKMTELHEMGVDDSRLMLHRKDCDDFVLPDKYAVGYRRLGIVYRNRYIIENTDFIIAYNKYQGRAYEFCKKAKNKGVIIIELAEEDE